MIRILRPLDSDEVGSMRIDKTIREAMEERGYTFTCSGMEGGKRSLEFDGASQEGEYRDYMNAILADVLSMRVPNTLIEIEYRPEFSEL